MPALNPLGRVSWSSRDASRAGRCRPIVAIDCYLGRRHLIREETMLRDPDRQVMEKAYARWAPLYDVLCGPVFVNGRRAAARAARRPLTNTGPHSTS